MRRGRRRTGPRRFARRPVWTAPGVNAGSSNARMRARRSIRLREYDYTQPGVYFVTICTHGRRLLFEEPALKALAEECWQRIPEHHPGVGLDAWVVMPNHLHGLVVLKARGRGVQLNAPTSREPTTRNSVISPRAGTLSVIVRTYKAAVTTRCRRAGYSEFAWQRNYYEHIVRDEHDLLRLRKYVQENPLKWESDEYHPAMIPVRA